MRLTILLIFLFLLFTNFVSASTGKLIYSRGTVELLVSKGGKRMFQRIKVGDVLKSGDIVRTRKDALAILELGGGSKLKLNPLSSITIKSSKKDDEEVNLNRGSAFINVLKNKLKKNTKAKFRLKTKTVSMGVRGTSFFASYGKRVSKKSHSDVWMCVNDGLVEVTTPKSGQKVKVKAGEGIKVDKGKEISDPKPLAWTKKLNWNMDPDKGDLENKVSIESAYTDILDEDYD